MKLVPKNWVDFQHYRDRAPPWIKLHKSLIDDRKFQCLPVASRALAPMLWLIASEEKNGEFDGTPAELAFRLRQTEKEIDAALKPLISNGFFIVVQGASDLLAECKRDAIPETEGETEKEAKEKRDSAPPDGVSLSVWQDFQKLRKTKKAPVTATAIEGIRREALKAGMGLNDALALCCQRGWTGFKADWASVGLGPMMTVSRPDTPDPALEKLERDRKLAVPIPENIRKQLDRLRVSPSTQTESGS